MRYDFSADVESDLEAIGDYIAFDNPRRSITFVDEIRAKFFVLSRNPRTYQLRPDIGPEARIAVVGRYIILFRIRLQDAEEFVRIERVLHAERDLPTLLAYRPGL